MADRLRELLQKAKESLRETGSVIPVLFVEGPEESALVAFEDMGRTAEERRAVLFARRLVHMRPRRITTVVDAYWKADESLELPLGRPLADDPDAEECVMAVSLDRRGRSRLLICPYERHPKLEGLEIEFKRVRRLGGQGEPYLLRAFFQGVKAGDLG